MTRTCSKCKELKDITEFNKKGKSKTGITQYQPYCRCCNKTRSKAYYRANKVKHKQVTSARRAKQIAKLQRFMLKFLYKKRCVNCPEARIVCLDFDHIRGKKKGLISHMVHGGCSLETLKTEMRKCQLLCANCHRVKTCQDFPTYKCA